MNFSKTVIAAGFALALVFQPAQAQPVKSGIPLEPVHKKKHVESLGPGSELVLVCKNSDSAMLVKIKDAKEARELCREGRMIECPDCHKKYRVIWKNPTGKTGGPEHVMEIVNAKGEPCMFLARIK